MPKVTRTVGGGMWVYVSLCHGVTKGILKQFIDVYHLLLYNCQPRVPSTARESQDGWPFLSAHLELAFNSCGQIWLQDMNSQFFFFFKEAFHLQG